MIEFNYLSDIELNNETPLSRWITNCAIEESFLIQSISYIFCDDDYLLNINIKYLKHNTLTDIISFNDTLGKNISGDIFISTDRVKENANTYNVSFLDELHRVMIHGVLHFCGYKDKTEEEKKLMRSKEDYYLSLRQF